MFLELALSSMLLIISLDTQVLENVKCACNLILLPYLLVARLKTSLCIMEMRCMVYSDCTSSVHITTCIEMVVTLSVGILNSETAKQDNKGILQKYVIPVMPNWGPRSACSARVPDLQPGEANLKGIAAFHKVMVRHKCYRTLPNQ